MANESKKDFNAMMKNNKDMPKIQIVEDEKTIKKYGGTKMFFAPPLYYDTLMKKVPKGKLVTVSQMRDYLAKQNNADFTDPMTAGIFVNIVAWASYQRNEDITPYWRTLKSDGELNVKYPEAIELQKRLLEEEGHTPPLYYDTLMKKVPKGKLVTVSQMRDYLAKQNNADFTDPMTAGIFVNIVAWASYQRNEDITPYWRTLKSDGELNVKYPEAIELQKRLLEEEGHTIVSKGTKNIKYYVKDFENSLIEL